MDANRYMQNLFDYLQKAKISDLEGQILELNDGIIQIINLIKSQTKSGKKILFIGNGGSAAIASHETIDFWKNGGIRAICFNEAALLTCIGNDYGYEHVFEKPIGMFADPGDILVAISSSGQSQNILLGVKQAKKNNCKVVTFSGFLNTNPLKTTGDYNVYIPSESYGFVELSHQIILHMILDMIMESRG